MKEWGEEQGETEPDPPSLSPDGLSPSGCFEQQYSQRHPSHTHTHTHTQAGLGTSLGVPTLPQVKLASFPCQFRKHLRQSRKPVV